MELEQRVKNIEDRNKKVEEDKAWETSITRRVLSMIFSYVAVGIIFQILEVPKPWLNAIVPALAFMIQQLSMPVLKRMWIKYNNK